MKTLHDWVLLNQHAVSPTPLTPPAERVKAGNPEQTLWNHYSDPSQQFHVGFWACEPGRWAIHYTEHEYCQLLEGDVVIHDSLGVNLPSNRGISSLFRPALSGSGRHSPPVARSM